MVARPRRRSSSAGRTLLGAVLVLLAAACADRQAPGTLHGRWISEDPRYADRSLDIAATTIALGQGGVRSQVFPIEAVVAQPGDEGGTLYEIRYRTNEGDTGALRLLALPGSPPSLRFENHDERWIRDAGSPGALRGNS